MSKLLMWDNLIDVPEMTGWYKELPGDLAAEYASYKPRRGDFEPYPNFARLKKRVVEFVDNSIKPFNPVMHNPQMHFWPVAKNGMDAGKLYVKHNPRVNQLPASLVEAYLNYLWVGFYSHDAGHCACTFRKDAPRGLFLPRFGVKRSVEWVTAYAVNEYLKKKSVPLPPRLMVVGMHFASTYGGNTVTGKRLGLPVPKPRTFAGASMKAADICPEAENTVERWFQRSIAVMYGEVPAIPVPQTWEDYRLGEVKFIFSYCIPTMRHMDEVAGFPISYELGWHDRLDQILTALDLMRDRRSGVAQYVQRELRKYGVTFD